MFISVFQTYVLPVMLLAIVGGVFGVLIAVISKVFAVKVDERMEKVTNLLPGYNCGACGYPGCAGFAEGIVGENVDVKLCKPGKQDMRDQIKAYLEQYEQEQKNK